MTPALPAAIRPGESQPGWYVIARKVFDGPLFFDPRQEEKQDQHKKCP